MHLIRMLTLSGLLTLAVAAPAAADSIAYVKDSNVWLANPDGSHQVQITHDGNATTPYRSPSQADDGTIAAGHGSEIVKLAQSGQVLAQFAPPTAIDSTGQVIADVPQQIAISPDGARIAYVYSQPSCPPGGPCGVRQELLYSFSDRTTPVSTFGEQTGLTNPSWIDNGRVLAFGGHFRQVNIDSLGGGDDDALHWFDDAGNEDVGDGELSRQGDRLALVRSYGDNTHIAIYHVSGGAGGSAPEAACYTGTDAALAGPSWSPDGTRLAFQDEEGVEVLPLPQVVAGDCPGATSSSVIIPGATAPDWAPAAIASNAGTYVASGAPGIATPPMDRTAAPPTGKHPRLRASLPRSVRLTVAAAKGILIHARGSASGRVTASVLLGRRRLATASVHVSAGARVALRLRLSRASVKLLRRARGSRVTVTVTLIPATGTRTTTTATLHLTRR